MPVQKERATLVHKRSVIKRRITNLEKKIATLVAKTEVTEYDMVCAKQFLDDFQDLDQQFQSLNTKASELTLTLEDPELSEKVFEELEMHDDRVRETTSRLVYFMSSKSNSNGNVSPQNSDEKEKKMIGRK